MVDFSRGACTFCAACAQACPEACFTTQRTGRPWALVAIVSTACIEAKGVACRLCEAGCEADAIRFRPRLGGGSHVTIDGTACTGCGACLPHCPVGALAVGELRLEEART